MTAGQQSAVEFLQIHGAEFFQRDFVNVGRNVAVDVAAIGLVARRPDFNFAHIFEPLVHPLRNIVLSLFGEIQFAAFRERLFQLFPGFRLRMLPSPFDLRFAICGTSFVPDILLYFFENSYSPSIPKNRSIICLFY